jgi:replication-associated recombination protein RarA
MSDFKMTTTQGYDFFEVSSAFQKSVRRGLEEDTMYWGIELYNSGYDAYAWKRMLIMVSEDIGLAAPGLAAEVKALYDIYEQLKKKKEKSEPQRLQFTHALLLLVRAAKSRYVDMAIFTYWRDNRTTRKEIPDWALDMHTRRGIKMGRRGYKGLQHFYEEGGRIVGLPEHMAEAEQAMFERCWQAEVDETKNPKPKTEQVQLKKQSPTQTLF